jgi:hypothetical protein
MLASGRPGSFASAALFAMFTLLYWSLYVSSGGTTVKIDFETRTFSVDPPYGFGVPIDARFEDVAITCTEGTHRRKYGRQAPTLDLRAVRDAGTVDERLLFTLRVYDKPAAIALTRDLVRAIASAQPDLLALEDRAVAVGTADGVVDVMRFAAVMVLGFVPALAFSR